MTFLSVSGKVRRRPGRRSKLGLLEKDLTYGQNFPILPTNNPIVVSSLTGRRQTGGIRNPSSDNAQKSTKGNVTYTKYPLSHNHLKGPLIKKTYPIV